MGNTPQKEKEWTKLDFKKYGLECLENKDPLSLLDSDIEKLIDAFASESMAAAIPMSPTTQTVMQLLSTSYCRRCGKCCMPNPTIPNHPGVAVSKEDLLEISRHSNYSYKYLRKKTVLNTDPCFGRGRYLPLPCTFYNGKRHECQIYTKRPFTCKIFPISNVNVQNRVRITIDVRCDYGKDIYRKVINYLKKESLTSAIENTELS